MGYAWKLLEMCSFNYIRRFFLLQKISGHFVTRTQYKYNILSSNRMYCLLLDNIVRKLLFNGSNKIECVHGFNLSVKSLYRLYRNASIQISVQIHTGISIIQMPNNILHVGKCFIIYGRYVICLPFFLSVENGEIIHTHFKVSQINCIYFLKVCR